jgi:glycerol-3-phosphate O-acyltransferase
VPRQVAQDKARRYAKEIVPSFSAYTYFGIGTRLARWVSRLLYKVRLGFVDEAAFARVNPDSTVVFVINHRSNVDYILVTYMAATSSALSYAVGEWARVWLLQSLIRAMGAYFVRRDSTEPLYRKVLSRYVHMSTSAGVTQAVFPEGGLTRDGALRPPKLGLLAYMVSQFDPHGSRDIVFVPVGLNYDRVLEDRVQTAAMATPEGEKPRFKFNAFVLLGFVMKHLWRKITGRYQRFGYACVSFGAPVSLRGWLAERGDADLRTLPPEQRMAEIARLGETLIAKVGDVVPALPVPLVATTLVEAAREGNWVPGTAAFGLTVYELKGRVLELMRRLEASGRHVHIPRNDREHAVELGLEMLLVRHLAVKDEATGLVRAEPKERVLLEYYANSIGHLLVAPPAGRIITARPALARSP